jgi:HEAT repeat protein
MQVRVGAIETLAVIGDGRATVPIQTLLEDRFSDVRESAQRAVAKLSGK